MNEKLRFKVAPWIKYKGKKLKMDENVKMMDEKMK
jgi:hypothetical protein